MAAACTRATAWRTLFATCSSPCSSGQVGMGTGCLKGVLAARCWLAPAFAAAWPEQHASAPGVAPAQGQGPTPFVRICCRPHPPCSRRASPQPCARTPWMPNWRRPLRHVLASLSLRLNLVVLPDWRLKQPATRPPAGAARRRAERRSAQAAVCPRLPGRCSAPAPCSFLLRFPSAVQVSHMCLGGHTLNRCSAPHPHLAFPLASLSLLPRRSTSAWTITF